MSKKLLCAELAQRVNAGPDRSATVFRSSEVGQGMHNGALQYGLLKQSLRQRGGHEQGNRYGACGLAENRYAFGIATERRDVGLDPFQCGDLVQQTVVAGGLLRRLR